MNVVLSSNSAAFNSALGQYMGLTKALPDEVLEKKGRDLGIRLFRGFRGRQYGGPQRNAGIARRDLATRTAAGQGTRVRRSLLNEYFEKRQALRSEIKGFVGPQNSRGELRSIKRRVALWQSFVGREIGLRQRGIGVLAASFLWFRRRTSQARGTFYVRNKTGRPLGSVEKGEGYLRIVSATDGLVKVNQRYGIVDRALGDAATDMMEYIRRKERENFFAAFGLKGAA